MRPAALVSLTMLGFAALLVVFVNDAQDTANARGEPLLEWYGLGLLAVSALLVVVLAALFRRQTWLGYALAPLTLAVVVVAFVIGVSRFD